MHFPSAFRWPVLVALQILLTVPLSASEFDQLVAVLKKTWPERREVAMVCDLTASQPFVDDLLKAAAGGLKVKVYPVKGPSDIGRVATQILGAKTDLLVLVPSDPVAGDGLKEAEYLIKKIAGSKIPTVATTESGVRQGALIGVGPGTGGVVFTNPKAAAVVGLSLPPNGKSI
jgi:ABC-type uncharacterized transport system substrate-binding protein